MAYEFFIMFTKQKKSTVALWFEMDNETNRLLDLSAKLNRRSKRAEAEVRLKDHLKKFNHEMGRF